MTRVSALLGLVACGVPELPVVDDPCAAWEAPGDFDLRVDAPDGTGRRSLVYVPPGEGPRDLVVMLHGGGQHASDIQSSSGWDALAEEEGFVVVYPEGTGRSPHWASGSPAQPQVDDVGYLDEVVRVVSERVCGRDVLGVGFSNGGSMAHRWGCEGRRVDAIVPTEAVYLLDDCPEAPRPVRLYHGLADESVPYEGGVEDGVAYLGVEEVAAIKREQNGCDPAIPPTTDVQGPATCSSWTCEVPVVLCAIDDLTHEYPGGTHATQDYDATADSWSWFRALSDSP